MVHIQNPIIFAFILGAITFIILCYMHKQKKDKKNNNINEPFYRSVNGKYIITIIVMILTYFYFNMKIYLDSSNNIINVIENLPGTLSVSTDSIDVIAPGINIPKYNGKKIPPVLINAF